MRPLSRRATTRSSRPLGALARVLAGMKEGHPVHPHSVTIGQMEFMIGRGVRLPERDDHAKPEGRPRAAGHDLVLSDGKWRGGDVTMTANLYPVHDGTEVTTTVAHLNAVGHALDSEMAPR